MLFIVLTNEEITYLSTTTCLSFRTIPWVVWVAGSILTILGTVLLCILFWRMENLIPLGGTVYSFMRIRTWTQYLVSFGFLIGGLITLNAGVIVTINLNKIDSTISRSTTDIFCRTFKESFGINKLVDIKIVKKDKKDSIEDDVRYNLVLYLSESNDKNKDKIVIMKSSDPKKVHIEVIFY